MKALKLQADFSVAFPEVENKTGTREMGQLDVASAGWDSTGHRDHSSTLLGAFFETVVAITYNLGAEGTAICGCLDRKLR